MSDTEPVAMRPETFFEFIKLNVPDCWSCMQKPGELLGCWQDGNDNGTIWVDYNLFSIPEVVHDSVSSIDQASVMVDGLKNQFTESFGSCNLEGTPEKAILSYSRNYDDEDGTPVRSHSFHHIVSSPGAMLLVHLTLVMPAATLNEPQCAAISERMMAEIKNPEIDAELGVSLILNGKI